MATCDPASGKFGKVLSVNFESSFPTSFTADITGTSGNSMNDVTLYMISVGRECGQGASFAYIKDNKLWFPTAILKVDSSNRVIGKMGFKTYDNDGNQMDKVTVKEPGVSIMDQIMTARVDSASDGTTLKSDIELGNPNNTTVFEKVMALPSNQNAGKRRTKKHKRNHKKN